MNKFVLHLIKSLYIYILRTFTLEIRTFSISDIIYNKIITAEKRNNPTHPPTHPHTLSHCQRNIYCLLYIFVSAALRKGAQ